MIISIDEEPGKSRPYPDFINISFKFHAISNNAEKVLRVNNIEYKTKPIEVENGTEISYALVNFPDMTVLNLEMSNLEIVNGKTVTKGKDYFSPTLSSVVLSEKAYEIKGIVRIKELLYDLVCTEEVKMILEKNKLVGIEFKKLEITK